MTNIMGSCILSDFIGLNIRACSMPKQLIIGPFLYKTVRVIIYEKVPECWYVCWILPECPGLASQSCVAEGQKVC